MYLRIKEPFKHRVRYTDAVIEATSDHHNFFLLFNVRLHVIGCINGNRPLLRAAYEVILLRFQILLSILLEKASLLLPGSLLMSIQ